MATKFPYVSSAGPLVAAVDQLRKSFPNQVSAETLKKLGIASNNESYVINTLRFLRLIDEDGNKNDERATVFLKGDEDFKTHFATLVKEVYADLFELHGDEAWTLSKAALTQFFRTADHSSEVVGKRQAGTFACLAGLSGHTDLPATRVSSGKKPAVKKKPANKSKSAASGTGGKAGGAQTDKPNGGGPDVGLTVRIEVNLPAEGDQATYDRIFKSIRKNLIDGE